MYVFFLQWFPAGVCSVFGSVMSVSVSVLFGGMRWSFELDCFFVFLFFSFVVPRAFVRVCGCVRFGFYCGWLAAAHGGRTTHGAIHTSRAYVFGRTHEHIHTENQPLVHSLPWFPLHFYIIYIYIYLLQRMLAHLAAFGRQGSRLSRPRPRPRRALSGPRSKQVLRLLCSSKSSSTVSSPHSHRQQVDHALFPHLPISPRSKNLGIVFSRLSRRLPPRTHATIGGRREYSTEPAASSASALEAANNAARQAQLTYAKAISTAKSNALFRKLFFVTVPAGAFGGVAFFYWYTQERHEVKVQKAVIDPHLSRKLEDLKPADTASHPYSSRSWIWKLFFIIARTTQLLWIWTPVICIAPVVALTGHKGLRKYLIKLLVKTTKRAGCSFVKFGQWVSMRPDIFAADIVAAMKHLMTDAPAHSYAETRRIIQESFGLSIEDLFDNFEAVPVASGSVAQVHRATLRPHQSPSGKPIVVAVKVLHPETLDETYIDIQIMTYVSLASGHSLSLSSSHVLIVCIS